METKTIVQYVAVGIVVVGSLLFAYNAQDKITDQANEIEELRNQLAALNDKASESEELANENSALETEEQLAEEEPTTETQGSDPTIVAKVSTKPAAGATESKALAAGEGMATVVFMRSSFMGGFDISSVYDVTGGQTRFLGIMKNKTKIEYKVKPGKRTFMVVSEAADFMEANLVAGKTYYSMVVARSGAWKSRFSLIPIRNDGTTDFNTDSKDFAKWKAKTKPVSLDEKSKAWYEKHKESVEAKRTKYWVKWKEKSPADLAERTLNRGDGV
jgi:hypothetical protein